MLLLWSQVLLLLRSVLLLCSQEVAGVLVPLIKFQYMDDVRTAAMMVRYCSTCCCSFISGTLHSVCTRGYMDWSGVDAGFIVTLYGGKRCRRGSCCCAHRRCASTLLLLS